MNKTDNALSWFISLATWLLVMFEFYVMLHMTPMVNYLNGIFK